MKKRFISAAHTPRQAAGTDRRWGFQRGAKSSPLVAVRAGFHSLVGHRPRNSIRNKNTSSLGTRVFIYPLLALVFVVSTAWAVQSPVALLQGISNRMIAQLERNKSRLKQMRVVHSIVRNTLLPYVDLNRMSALVVGPNYWRSATGAQKSQFKNEFTRMVISTYAVAISSYDGDRVLFYPLRGGYSGRTVQVRSVIVRRNGQRIPVSYNLVRTGNTWRVFDFSVENVSIVQSYRAQFAGVLSGRGMGGLVQRLRQHNRKIR